MDSLPLSVVAAAWPGCAVLRGMAVSTGIRDILCAHPVHVCITVPGTCALDDITPTLREAMQSFHTRSWTAEIEVPHFRVFASQAHSNWYIRQLVAALGPPVTAFRFSSQVWYFNRDTIASFFAAATGLTRLYHRRAVLGPEFSAGVASLEHLTELRLPYLFPDRKTLLQFFDALAAAPAAPRLTVLELSCHGACELSAPCLASFERLLAAASALRTLDASAFVVAREDFNCVYAPYTRLTTLSVTLKYLFDAPDVAVLATLPSLRSLALHHAYLIEPGVFALLRELPTLASLTLCNSSGVVACLVHDADAIGEATAGLTRLTALDMLFKPNSKGLHEWGAGFLRAVDNPRLTLCVVPHWSAPDDSHLAPFSAAVAAGRLRAVRDRALCDCDWHSGA